MNNGKKHARFKIFSTVLAFMLIITETFIYVPVAYAKDTLSVPGTVIGSSVTIVPETATGPSVTIIPEFSGEPAGTNTPAPSGEPVSTNTPAPSRKPVNTSTPEPSAVPVHKVSCLKEVSGVELVRYSANSIKVTWKKHKKAKFYRVYYSDKKKGNAHLAGITKNTHYRARKLKNNTVYYFYVVACKARKASDSDSKPSKKVHMKTRTYTRKIIFAGDSITKGITDYGMLGKFSMKGKKKVVAGIGLNTITFRTRRIFDGMSGLQKVIAEKPARLYMMLGINEVNYRRIDDMLSDYRELVQAIKRGSPGTDIVLCAISPVTMAERIRYSGFKQLQAFNRQLKKLAKKMDARYFDYTDFLKDSGGYLKTQYAERDGYHWKPFVYLEFADVVSKYDKSLDN